MDLTLVKLHNHGTAILFYAAALASAKTVAEAYEAQHYLEQRVNAAGEIFDTIPESDLGFQEGNRSFPTLLAK